MIVIVNIVPPPHAPGTSTDVSRYAGQYEHVFEATTAGVTLQAPQLDINTVAAGGGSRLFFRSVICQHVKLMAGEPKPFFLIHSKAIMSKILTQWTALFRLRSGMFVVGPESAGAHPGPACYRKGNF